MKLPFLRPVVIAAAALAIGGCSSYGSYGYSGVSVGYGTGYSPYYGWYDGFYYPGTGYYVYDRYGSRHRWSDRHRRYWYARRSGHRHFRDNWSDYRRERRADRREWREDRREWRRDRAENRRDARRDRREVRRERREDHRERRRDRRRDRR